MTLCRELQSRESADRIYINRKHGGRGLKNAEDCVRTEENGLGFYLIKTEEMLLVDVANQGVSNVEEFEQREEAVIRLISECSKLAQTVYKRRHTGIVNNEFCKKYELSYAPKRYRHTRNSPPIWQVKIVWNFTIQSDHETKAVVDKTSMDCQGYQDLKVELH